MLYTLVAFKNLPRLERKTLRENDSPEKIMREKWFAVERIGPPSFASLRVKLCKEIPMTPITTEFIRAHLKIIAPI